MRRLALAVLLASGSLACQGVPDLTFDDDGGGTSSSTDAGTDSTAPPGGDDGAVTPLPDGALPPSDSAVGDGGPCPGSAPPGQFACCGAILCSGDPHKCANVCTTCQDDCNPGQTCCIDHSGTFTGCFSSSSKCP